MYHATLLPPASKMLLLFFYRILFLFYSIENINIGNIRVLGERIYNNERIWVKGNSFLKSRYTVV